MDTPTNGTQARSSREAINEALALANEAVSLDVAGEVEASVAAYEQSVACLVESISLLGAAEASGDQVARLQQIRDGYADRAGVLRVIYGLPTPPMYAAPPLPLARL